MGLQTHSQAKQMPGVMVAMGCAMPTLYPLPYPNPSPSLQSWVHR